MTRHRLTDEQWELIKGVIPSKKNEDRDTRSIEFDREAYRRRNIVERLIGWLKEARRIFSRFEKTAKNFGGMIKMAFIHRYLNPATAQAFSDKAWHSCHSRRKNAKVSNWKRH